MSEERESLPMPRERLEETAEYYDTHDTSADMDEGQWNEPPSMVTTSLRLTADTVAQLKSAAAAEGVRYTAYIREVLEDHLCGAGEMGEIRERLERIENALTRR